MNTEICEITCVDEEKVNRSIAHLKKLDSNTVSKIFKILSDENRLKIVFSLLNEAELCVCDLATIIQATIATTSHHLQVLRKAGIVDSKKKGKLVYYSMNNEGVCHLLLTSMTLDKNRGVTI
ncbi:helix-turn-helix transcriptional regulator [Enterococcus saccharolyticus]|uniref:ArsR/SmtB family transcription factor n=1 Tax=Enterococcus TaxID=1350 RepID=UPI001E34153B|nr:metalloregulator ArsR/SmtB family transcription factor [Enterococcus saccharolyticus]MCD5002400.1 helix-turn-helix transcriptional regulator [Enterococcus saccharolyticus]